MIKIVRFVKRRKDLTLEEFKDYWLTKHSELEQMIVEKTTVRKIVASFSTGEMIGGKEPPFDGMVEIYFDNEEDRQAFYACDIHKKGIMREDEKNFVDHSEEPVRIVTEEHVIAEKPRG